MLLILAGVVIATLTGENGIIGKASDSKTESRAAEVEDRVEMWKQASYADDWLDNDTEKDRDDFIDELASEGLLIGDEPETAKTSPYTITIGSKTISFSMDANDTGDGKETISTSEDYSGYYADVDGDGTVDGIIYADLAIAGSGTWSGDSWSSYSWSAVSNLKSYEVSQEGYSDDFGTKDVLKVTSTSGNDRFYVMALDQLGSYMNGRYQVAEYYWYYSAYSSSSLDSSYNVATSTNDFGEGKANTIRIKTANDAGTYGTKNSRDLWQLWTSGGSVTSVINSKTYTMVTSTSDSGKWFVPSKAEWAAFADYAFTDEGVTTSTHWDFDLGNRYWSSTQYSTKSAYTASITHAYISNASVNDMTYCYVRLSATF